ncbi:carbamoyltransferase HypF [Dendrosporobacter sp. 1207_IL3150]|uniref:carbamoyltransferase HypF n=1 Tax=Dendrosporobacter sp. 1207_IL3150 TaxID=3084054 RepID=UPI002FD90265
MIRLNILVRGTVQGVGFRPFIYRLASEYNLKGWVRNNSAGVEIEIEGTVPNIELFQKTITSKKPQLAVITKIITKEIDVTNSVDFKILESNNSLLETAMISSDAATCQDCLADITNDQGRRYGYAFTNCTNCGPRYTIIKSTPYDRAATTMDSFKMCDACKNEYNDPANRRFHAQPNACPVCGPQYQLLDNNGQQVADETTAFELARQLIAAGYILAVKGLGGYHLACNAYNESAVKLLRARKIREDKPFAVMAGSLDTLKTICIISDEETKLLTSPESPIVLLNKSSNYNLAETVSPDNPRIGVMLPYTPAHSLLIDSSQVWVMTSGNASDEPIAYEDTDALCRLSKIADYFLVHNRPIYRRADDSIAYVINGSPALLRRSRGYTPSPIKLPKSIPSMLACGGELKSTFCLTRDNNAYLSTHIGDLETPATYDYYVDSIRHYKQLLNIEPECVAYDFHPEYLSTKYALSLEIPKVAVQHHHAHIAAVMAEHGLQEAVIGVAFDGTGYGDDGSLWGGEFLVADYKSYIRAAHCNYLPLPGGSKAIKEPWRLALAVLYEHYGDTLKEAKLPVMEILPPDWPIVIQMLDKKLNCPLTSSAGRLFDIVAALCKLRTAINYEGQAAVELELAAGNTKGIILPYEITTGRPSIIDFMPTYRKIIELLGSGYTLDYISASFHNTVADAIFQMIHKVSHETGIANVVLSGGVFQNIRLLNTTLRLLADSKFRVLIPRQVPPNDGGLALGQALIAAANLKLI